MRARNIDHVTLSVRDIDEATTFFHKAFGAKVIVDDPHEGMPVGGSVNEAVFGMPRGAVWTHRRVLAIGPSHLEMFQFVTDHQQRAAHSYDLGLAHFAIYVDDLAQAAHDFKTAGGKMYPTYGPTGLASTIYPHQGWAYGETPWGTVVEMVTFREISNQ